MVTLLTQIVTYSSGENYSEDISVKKFRLLTQCLSIGMLSAILGTIIPQMAQAQRSTYLPNLQCTTRQGNFSMGNTDVSIMETRYSSILRTSGMSMTCNLPGGTASLDIQYGVADSSDKPPAKIEVYVDGNLLRTQVGVKGILTPLLVNVSNGKSLTINISCSTGNNCGSDSYHFTKFHLIQSGR